VEGQLGSPSFADSQGAFEEAGGGETLPTQRRQRFGRVVADF
jgi:hypothetical protein